MLLLVDECFPRSLVCGLQRRGHDVTWASLVCRSADDALVLATATEQERIVVTEDRDFGTLIFRDGQPSVGVVIVHSSEYSGRIDIAMEAICDQINDMNDRLRGFLTTISPDRIRQRPLGATP